MKKFILIILAIAMVNSCTKNSEESLKNYNEGLKAYSLFKMGRAEKLFQKAIKNDSSNLNAYLMVGKIRYFKKDYSSALKYIEEILVRDEKNTNGLYWKARIKMMQKPPAKEEAKRSLREVVKMDSHHLPARLLLALIYESSGENRKALDHYRLALADQTYLINARLNLATLYSRLGFPKKAKSELKKAKMLSDITGKASRNIKLMERELVR